MFQGLRTELLLPALTFLGLLVSPPSLGQTMNRRATPELATPVQSQQLPQMSDQQLRTFVRSFQENVYKGCMQNPPSFIRNHSNYCKCYADSFLNRYSATQLVRINQAAGTSQQTPRVIALMMAPELDVCVAANR
ncbi:MAG: hypothetical protein ACKN89_17245 [Cyanobium sp.]|jgi:hypothetical protein|nr:hypothetical protein [Synechococcaceae cyanobacterium]